MKDATIPQAIKPLNVFPMTVNYDRSVEDGVKAERYSWVSESITTKHFPSERKGTADVEFILVKFDRHMQSGDVVSELDGQGLRPAELSELLAFGEKYPDVRNDFPVVALGSIWRSSEGWCVPCLFGSSVERRLDLNRWDYGWCSSDRFAAVRR